MIQMQNIKFEVSIIICFLVMLITDTYSHTQTNTKNVILRFRRPQNVYIDQNLHFENFTPRRILSLLCVSKRKKEKE